MQDKIIAAITAYLDKVTTKDSNGFLTEFTWGHTSKIHATEIAAAIAPMVEAKDYPYNELFNHMANEHGLTLTNTELGDIIHIARCGTNFDSLPKEIDQTVRHDDTPF